MKLNFSLNTRLFSYIVSHDGGSAPNPFDNICTLAICKPTIRRTANDGDVIVGLSPKNFGSHLVYCMVASEVIKWNDYIIRCNSDKRFLNRVPSSKLHYGDCIYSSSSIDNVEILPSWSNHEKDDFRVDVLKGEHVIVSYQYWYFGSGNKYKIELPERLIGMIPGRGHKVTANHDHREPFQHWFNEYMEKNNISMGKTGEPRFAADECETEESKCSRSVCRASQDEPEEK